MKVIIYGGSFNPPTIAHQTIAESCLEYAAKINAQVWLMPSGDRTDKTISVDRDTRLCYLETFASNLNDRRVRIDLTEMNNAELTETNTTVETLKAAYPGATFYWVFGSDSIMTMREWENGERLWGELNMLVIERPGYEIKELPSHAEILDITPLAISSTIVREKLAKGEDISSLVPKGITACLCP